MAVNLSPFATFQASRIVAKAKPSQGFELYRIISLSASQGSYGAIGSAQIVTTISDPKHPGAPLSQSIATAARRGTVGVTINGTVSSNPKTLTTYAVVPIFTGIFDTSDAELENDLFTMHFRDVGAVLMERTVQPRLKIPQNQNVSAFIQELADEAGIPAVYIDSVESLNGTPLLLGSLFQNATYFTSIKDTTWGLLQRLAKQTGNVVFLTPAGELYFGPRDTGTTLGTPVRTLTFGQVGIGDLLTCTVTHQPYKHAAFIAQVNSHNRNLGSTTQETVCFLNSDIAADAGLRPGLLVGETVPELQNSVGSALPVYSVYAEGKQHDQVHYQALANARETQGQEIVIKGSCLGTTQLAVGDPVRIDNTPFDFVSDQPFTVVHVTYKFDLETSGWLCDFTAWASDAPISGTEVS